jgi:LPS-assembly protein
VRALRTGIAAALLLLWGGGPVDRRADAQPAPATLLADRVSYDEATGVLTAEGNVEVLYEGRLLNATRIEYDANSDAITATGPLVLTDREAGILLADDAELSADLSTGLIRGARLLLDDRLQLASAEVRRGGGRFTTLDRTIASTCTICAGNPTPTWAIRAARVTRDEEARRIYFENARIEAFGIPIGWAPQLSIPDAGVERADGVLIPDFQQSNIYGFGVKVPYYFTLGPSADATLTPFVTTTGALLFEGEYRRRFVNGGFDLSGVLSIDDGLDDGGGLGRGYFSGIGEFRLGRGYVAEFDVNITSDKSFLQQFDYSDADRLTSFGRIRRTTDDEYVDLGTIAFQSLRDDEDSATVPFILPDFRYRRILEAPVVGGRVGLDLEALGVLRENGQDMIRGGGGVDWRRDWALPRGVLAAAGGAADLTFYRTTELEENPEATLGRASPALAIELRWPLARAGADGATHVIEPIAQVIWSDAYGDTDAPNEDSQLVEFDTTNLFSLNRFPGIDRLETGLRANLGVSYTRYDPSGWSFGLSMGQVIRAEPDDVFWEATGLEGRYSDIVTTATLTTASGLSAGNRSVFDSDLRFSRNEFALGYDGEIAGIAATYIFLAAEDSNPFYGAQPETSEFGLDARYRFHPNWEIRGDWRYDVAEDSNLRAGGGLTYGNQCAEIDLRVSRRFTSSANVPPSTSFAFTVRLAGLGRSGERDWPPRVCLDGI